MIFSAKKTARNDQAYSLLRRVASLGTDDTRNPPGAILDLATLTWLIAPALVYLALSMDRTINDYDEGIILFGSARVLSGDIPHRDFYALYGPGQFYALAALFKIFGTSVLVERVWDTVVRCFCGMLVFVIVGQSAPRRFAFVAHWATVLCLGGVLGYGYPALPALAAALASLALLAPLFGRGGSAPRTIAAGACSGLTMLFRYDVGAAVFVLELVVLLASLVIEQRNSPHSLRPAMRAAALFGLGFALAIAPVGAAFAFAGAIPDLVFDVVTNPAQLYVRTRSLPFPRLRLASDLPEVVAVYFPLFAVIAAAPTILALARGRREYDGAEERLSYPVRQSWMPIALVALILAFYAKGFVRPETVQMIMALVTSLALIGVIARPMRGRGIVEGSTVLAAVVASYLFVAFEVRRGLHETWMNLISLASSSATDASNSGSPPISGSCRMPTWMERLNCFEVSPEESDVIRYVQQHTDVDDTIFVGLSRHDKIHSNNVFLYFAVNRKSATKWYHFDPGLQTSVKIQTLILGELRRANPKLIVIDPYWFGESEPNESALSSGVTLLDDYIKETFSPAATFGQYAVLRRRTFGASEDRDTIKAGR